MSKAEAEEQPTRAELTDAFFERIQRLSTWTVVFHQAMALSLGLNPTDLKCRGLLDETGGISAGELAELTGLTTAAITGVIDRLERVGLVRRVKDPSDRRRVVVEPLSDPASLRSVEAGFGPLAEATEQLIEPYSDAELEFVLEFLERSAKVMRAQTLELRAKVVRAKRG